MPYHAFRRDAMAFDPAPGGDTSRGRLSLTPTLTQMRSNIWRLPPGSRGRRHVEGAQEEMFIALEGTLTLHLGEPPERVSVPQGSVVVVAAGTPIQLVNDTEELSVVLVVGAPPVTGQGELLPDSGS